MSIDAAFTQFPIFTTSRLRLRQLQPSDAEAMFAIKSNLVVTHAYGRTPHNSLDDTQAWMERIHGNYERREGLVWAVTFPDKDVVIGSVLLWNFDEDYRCGELGYELDPAFWRQGIMVEAVPVVLRYVFADLDLHRIEAVTSAENVPSSSLLLKLGFTLEGTLRQRQFFAGHYADQIYFGLLKAEWLKSAAARVP
ncbi:MAG: GNAT family N-acetyltransferase [Anaerolineae bacterium]|nr:GNAT family N-acetyltransferase [Anaerolineae bacterium]